MLESAEEAYTLALVSRLPDDVRAALAEGPWPEPFCGVCRALDDRAVVPIEDPVEIGTPVADLPADWPASAKAAWELLEWHDAPFRPKDGHQSRHYREGKVVFARCQAIYRAAGWTG